jgi:hypothetical protein
MCYVHAFGCNVAIEAQGNFDEYFAHDSHIVCSDVGLTVGFSSGVERCLLHAVVMQIIVLSQHR